MVFDLKKLSLVSENFAKYNILIKRRCYSCFFFHMNYSFLHKLAHFIPFNPDNIPVAISAHYGENEAQRDDFFGKITQVHVAE